MIGHNFYPHDVEVVLGFCVPNIADENYITYTMRRVELFGVRSAYKLARHEQMTSAN